MKKYWTFLCTCLFIACLFTACEKEESAPNTLEGTWHPAAADACEMICDAPAELQIDSVPASVFFEQLAAELSKNLSVHLESLTFEKNKNIGLVVVEGDNKLHISSVDLLTYEISEDILLFKLNLQGIMDAVNKGSAGGAENGNGQGQVGMSVINELMKDPVLAGYLLNGISSHYALSEDFKSLRLYSTKADYEKIIPSLEKRLAQLTDSPKDAKEKEVLTLIITLIQSSTKLETVLNLVR